MPAGPYGAPMMPQWTSKSALFSLILGILGCVPFATGVLAIILGIIGFVKTGKPGVKGRWMAIVGSILGIVSLIAWTIGGFAMGAGIFAVIGLTQAPVNATHDFIRDVAANDMAAAKVNGPGFSDESLQKIHDYLATQGTFRDTTFTTRNIQNSSAHIEGTADFSGGAQSVLADLENDGGKWKVTSIDIKPK
jgi:hypothetical protein